MKQFKRFFYLSGVIVLLAAAMYGYFLFKRCGYKSQLESARQCYENGGMAEAIDILEPLYKKSPGSRVGEESAYLLGKSYINLNDLDKAEYYWNILKEQNKEKYGAECLFNMALIAKAKGETDKAMSDYEQLIKDFSNSDLVDDAMLNLALIYKEKGEFAEAQRRLMNISETCPQSNLIDTVENELGSINIELLFSPQASGGASEYIVKSGDSLFTIAQHFGTTVELIKKCNKLKSDFIRPGDKLKIITEKFSIIVDKSRNILTLKAGEKVLKVYRVGTGTAGSTPAGSFVITNKIVNPPWHRPGKGVVPFGDPENVLGTRWMGFNKTGYGIHGTWEPASIGKQESAGCVRLLNADVEEIFQIVPVNTEVTIIE